MTCSPRSFHRYTGRLSTLAMMGLVLTWIGSGCAPAGGGGNGNTTGDNANDNGTGGASFGSLTGTVQLSGNQSFSILYTLPAAATNAYAFYVQVASPVVGSTELGERVIFAENLPVGSGQTVTFSTGSLPVGYYRIGITFTNAEGETVTIQTTGVVQVQGSPNPLFVEPTEDETFTAGDENTLTIRFDCQDPENLNVRWRLAYASRATIDAWVADPGLIGDIRTIGTAVAEGSTNTGVVSWDISGLLVGSYGFFVSATDAGTSIGNTDDENRIFTTFATTSVIIVEPEPLPQPPVLTVTAPASDTTVYPGSAVTITWSASAFEGPDVAAPVSVFYDQDGEEDSGDEVFLLQDQATSVSSTTLDTTDLEEGTYLIGVTVDDGLNDALTRYAAGTVTVDGTVTFSVTAPATERNVPPTTIVDVSWTTNVPSQFRTFDVYYQSDPTGDGTMLGDAVSLLDDSTATSTELDTTGLSGLYVITVEMSVEGEDEPRVLVAPGKVRVTTAPTIFWLGELETVSDDQPRGSIYQGVNFEDNAGSTFAPAGDVNGDGNEDFLIAARYGKPFFSNSDGIGHGEAYLLYGSSVRPGGFFNLNSVGTSLLNGVTFAGIRTRQGNTDTDGLADITAIKDVDGDGRGELIFGFPFVASRGHNLDPSQDGVQDVSTLSTLEKHDQFLRGGIVIVSSTNSFLSDSTPATTTVNLDEVGQDFDITCVQPEPGDEEEFFTDIFNVNDEENPCMGSCDEPSTDEFFDSNFIINYGFHVALADDYWNSMLFAGDSCASPYFPNPCPVAYCLDPFGECSPTSPSLHWLPFLGTPSGLTVQYSGFYPVEYDINPDSEAENEIVTNDPREPFGARIIGVGLGDGTRERADGFGSSLTIIENPDGTSDMVVSSPNRTAIGILRQVQDEQVQGPEDDVIDGFTVVQGGEIDGLEDSSGNWTSNQDSGVAYLFQLRNLWTGDAFGQIPPKPHQYIVGEPSHCGSNLIANVDALRIAGNTGQRIRNIVGITDFNADGRDDFAVGSPGSQGGTVHIAFRRDPGVEGDFVLSKIEKSINDPERLQGAFITGEPGNSVGEGFGASMASGIDFNKDGSSDLIVSTPNLEVGKGAVDIILTSSDLITDQGGIDIDELRDQRRSVRILGFETGDLFGFNIANGGDIDGDGTDDLLISAPGATPHYDPNPNDTVDELTDPGLDTDLDGEADHDLPNAGLVYIILGSNNLGGGDFFDEGRYPDGVVDIRKLGTSDLRGAIIVGRSDGDLLGGGDAGNLADGGILAKANRGRSFGLRAAGDVDGDGFDDILIGSILADVVDEVGGTTKTNAGEAYLLYGFEP